MTTFRNRARSRWYATSPMRILALLAALWFAVYAAQSVATWFDHAQTSATQQAHQIEAADAE